MRLNKVREALKKAIENVEGLISDNTQLYDPPREAQLIILDPKTGHKLGPYNVEIDAERNGVWIISHRRPSGKWDRLHRARHIGIRDWRKECLNA